MQTRTRARALVGALLWLAMPIVPVGTPPSFGSVEHVFASMPLVVMPFALAVLSALAGAHAEATRRGYAIARRMQPVAGAFVLASLLVPQGALAAALVGPWIATAIVVAIAGFRSASIGARTALSSPSLFAVHVCLPAGAAWLLLWRLGVGPASFGPITALLAAVHFHFSGFALQLLVAAAGRERLGSRARALHRAIAVVAIVAIPLIAAGTIATAPLPKFVGVAAMVFATTTFAALSTAIARRITGKTPRRLLLVSAGSVIASMLLAAVYGVGELHGVETIGVSRMGLLHGLGNALGFTLCGAIAYLHRVAAPA